MGRLVPNVVPAVCVLLVAVGCSMEGELPTAASVGTPLALNNGPIVEEGSDPSADLLGAVRYRNFSSGSGSEIYLGVPDLSEAANRVELDFDGGPACDGSAVTDSWFPFNGVVFSYDPGTGLLETIVTTLSSSFCLEYSVGDLGELNYLQIDISNPQPDQIGINLRDVQLNNEEAGDFIGDESQKSWMITGAELTAGFTLVGELTLGTVGAPLPDGDAGLVEISLGFLGEEPPNQPPDCSAAQPSVETLWPPNHQFVAVDVLGVTDPDGDPVAIIIESIFQDEPVNGRGDGNTAPDGDGVGTATAQLRAERAGIGNGRVYHIGFSADDGNGGMCSGELLVGVPKSQGKKGGPVDDGALYDSTES